MAKAAAARLADFESRARHAPEDVLRHGQRGWRYIAVHPFADDRRLLERLGWPAERCRSVDAYWECGGDVYLVQVEAADDHGLRAPGLYYRRLEDGRYAANLVAVVETSTVARAAFESALSRFAPALPRLGKARKLAAVPAGRR
jgi:hypothetical protein